MNTLLLLGSLHTTLVTRIQDQKMNDRFATATRFTVLIERIALALFARLRPLVATSHRA
jgi:hypothetical protein